MEDLDTYISQFNLDEKNWYYKGEGSAHLVIALRNERKVLRIRKEEKNKTRQTLQDEISVDYYEKVVLPLFSSAYFQVPHIGRINEKEANMLNENLRNIRPQFRQNKVITPGYVTVFEDLTLLPKHLTQKFDAPKRNCLGTLPSDVNPVFCIEIKPKQGWLALPDRKYSKCSFCLNQYLKLSDKFISSYSEYCPLDLFSGDRTRMLNAINSLLRTPQNNVRIFQDGILLFGDAAPTGLNQVLEGLTEGGNLNSEIQDVDNFSTLVFNMLTSASSRCDVLNNQPWGEPEVHLENNTSCETSYSVPSRVPTDSIIKLSALLKNTSCCNFSSQHLPPYSVLDKILKIQKLDTYGADYVHHYFKTQDEASVRKSFIKDFPRALNPIERYLLSTMAKDCSILISFQNLKSLAVVKDESPIAVDLLNNKYVFQINVADVDAKPVECIEKHFKRDNRVVEAALKLLMTN